MKIVVFNGSHRKQIGNTQIMVDEFLSGAQSGGAEVRQIKLLDYKIELCKACKLCWKSETCILTDDFNFLAKTYLEADVVGFASPIYVDNLTGLMKVFLDRLISIANPMWELDEKGECRHKKRHDKPQGMICFSNCGYPEQSHFEVISHIFHRMSRNMSTPILAEIYRGGGGLLTMNDQRFNSFTDQYLQLLFKAGQEFVQNQQITIETMAKLTAPILPGQNYVENFLNAVNNAISS